jgi:RNA polymerase sigma-70 factor (ECF subfamily)
MVEWIRARAPAFAETLPDDADALAEHDARLVARARADRQAFAPLYARYLDPVYRYCFRRLGSRESAEDATSQVFFNALNWLDSYRNERSFGAWLFAIARNVVADVHRRRRPTEPLEAAPQPVDPDPLPEEAALVAEASRSVRTLLTQLPADQRSVVELRLAGLTGPEIARALDRSLGSVKMLQLRAVSRLRTLVRPEPPGLDACHVGSSQEPDSAGRDAEPRNPGRS